MEIRCKKGDCKHNTGCSCSARSIEISRGTGCCSYRKDQVKENLIIENGNIFEISEELVTRNLKSVPLDCRAKNCLYNRNELCCANGITVIDGNNHDNAECATYINK